MAESKVEYAEPEYAQHKDKSKVPYYRANLDDHITPEVSLVGPSITTARKTVDIA